MENERWLCVRDNKEDIKCKDKKIRREVILAVDGKTDFVEGLRFKNEQKHMQ